MSQCALAVSKLSSFMFSLNNAWMIFYKKMCDLFECQQNSLHTTGNRWKVFRFEKHIELSYAFFPPFPSTSRKFTHEFHKSFGSFTKWMGNTLPEYLQYHTFSCEFFFHNFCFQIIFNFSTECNNILWNYQLSNSAKQCSKWAKSKKNAIKTENCFQVSFHWVLRFWNEANSKLKR